MKEQFKNYQEEKTNAAFQIYEKKFNLDHKYNIDKEKSFFSDYANFHHYSNIIQDSFFNSDIWMNRISSLSIDGQLNNTNFCMNSQSFQMPSNELMGTLNSPNTPGSFGFKQCPFRCATATIQQNGHNQKFPNVKVYLVTDIFDQEKAGLVFQYENIEIDLKISKKEGVQLEREGQLKDIQCQLWLDDLAGWVDAQATITLHAHQFSTPPTLKT